MIIREIKQNYNKKDGSLYGERNVQDSLAVLYHENSKFNDYILREQGIKIASFDNPYIAERSTQPYKCYPNH